MPDLEEKVKRVSIEYNKELDRFYGMLETEDGEVEVTKPHISASKALAALIKYPELNDWHWKITVTKVEVSAENLHV